MAVVVGSASIRIEALTNDLKRDIGKALNDALGDIKITSNPLKGLNDELRVTSAETDRASDSLRRYRDTTNDTDRDTRKLHAAMTGLHGITRGLGAAFSFMLPSMGQVSVAGRIFTGTLELMTKATVIALAAQAAFAGAGGLVAVAGALSEAAGAALLLPAALGAAAIGVVTLTVGFQGMGEALKNVGDPAKFAEAIKELSPNAQAFAISVRDMVPAFKELRLQVQDRLFAGLGKDFAELGRIHLPIVQRGLSDMATALNVGAKEFSAFARDKQTISDLSGLFANSALGAHFLTRAVQPLLGALRDIGAVGAEFLPGLAEGFSGAAVRFGEFISKARESGQLREVLANGLAALKDIFAILGNIGSIIGSVLGAGQAAGAGFLSTAREVTGELKEWARSSQGQAAITEFLLAAKQAASALLPVIGSVVGVIAGQLAPILADIAHIVGPSVVIVVNAIGEALEIARPGITALAVGFADFLAALAPALPAIGNLARVLGESLGAVLTAIGPVIAQVASVFADQLAVALPQLVPAVISIATAFGDLLVALAPLIPSLVALLGPFVEAGGIIDALVPIIETLVAGFASLVEILQPVIGVIADSLIKVLDGVSDIMPELVDAFLSLVEALAPVVEQLLPVLVDLFVALLPVLTPVIQLITILIDLFAPLLQLITGQLVDAIGVLTSMVSVVVDGIGGLVGLGGMLLEQMGVIDGAQTGFAASSRNIADEVANQFGRVGSVLSTNEGQVGSWLDVVKGSMEDATVSLFGFAFGADAALARAVAAVGEGTRKIQEAMHATRDPASAAGTAAGQAYQGGIGGGLGAALRLARGTADSIGGALHRDFSGAGSAVMGSFAAGMRSATLNAVNAANAAMAAVRRVFPSSPAQEGPFSGSGWTLYGGMSLIEAFAEGIARSIPKLVEPSLLAAQTVSDGLLSTPGVTPGGLPPLSFATAAVRGGDGAVSPENLHEAIVEAIAGWEVTVSAREAASGVNKVNQGNRDR